MDVNKRLKTLLEETSISQSKLAKMWKISPQQINSYITEKSPINSLTILNRITDTWPNLNLNWLIKGTGEKWINDYKLEPYEEKIKILENSILDLRNSLKDKNEIIDSLKGEKIRKTEGV